MPNTKPKTTPEDFFLNLGAMAALYISAVALISLWWNYVDALFPDLVYSYYDPYSSAVRWAMAALIIVFPLFIWLTRILNQKTRKDVAQKELKVKKWLVYLTLFVAGLTIAIDLVAVLNNFLGGELSARFGLKALAVLLVAGAVFYYYLSDVKGVWVKKKKESEMYGWVVGIIILASIVAGFFVAGSPGHQRMLRFDQERVAGLDNLQWMVWEYYRANSALPEDETELLEAGYEIPTDPKTNEVYDYEKTGDLTYNLCAVFETSNESFSGSRAREFVDPNYNWDHDAGRECFERRINPNDFPDVRKVPPPVAL